jgi:Tol biopolymer transport system component
MKCTSAVDLVTAEVLISCSQHEFLPTVIVRINVGTGETTVMADYVNSFADFSASADGRTLAFVSEKADSPRDIWSVSMGQSPRQLTNSNPQVELIELV